MYNVLKDIIGGPGIGRRLQNGIDSIYRNSPKIAEILRIRGIVNKVYIDFFLIIVFQSTIV
jgi:hypothetical protein